MFFFNFNKSFYKTFGKSFYKISNSLKGQNFMGTFGKSFYKISNSLKGQNFMGTFGKSFYKMSNRNTKIEVIKDFNPSKEQKLIAQQKFREKELLSASTGRKQQLIKNPNIGESSIFPIQEKPIKKEDHREENSMFIIGKKKKEILKDFSAQYINLFKFISNYNKKTESFSDYKYCAPECESGHEDEFCFNFLVIFLLILSFIQIPISYYNFLNNIIYLIDKDICEDFYILHIIMIIILSILVSIPIVFSIVIEIKSNQNDQELTEIQQRFNVYFEYGIFTNDDLYIDDLENYILGKKYHNAEKEFNKNIAFTLYAFLNFKENVYKVVLYSFRGKNKIYFLISFIFALVFNILGFLKNKTMKILSIVFNAFILIFLGILLFQYYSLWNIAFINNKTKEEMESIFEKVNSNLKKYK